jgi:hypothetical protein
MKLPRTSVHEVVGFGAACSAPTLVRFIQRIIQADETPIGAVTRPHTVSPAVTGPSVGFEKSQFERHNGRTVSPDETG